MTILKEIEALVQSPLHSTEPLTGNLELSLPEKFFAFSGHFPGQPILPAVLQLKIGIYLCQKLVGRELFLTSIDRAKFLTPAGPDTNLKVSARMRPDGNGNNHYGAEIKIDEGAKKIATFSLILRAY